LLVCAGRDRCESCIVIMTHLLCMDCLIAEMSDSCTDGRGLKMPYFLRCPVCTTSSPNRSSSCPSDWSITTTARRATRRASVTASHDKRSEYASVRRTSKLELDFLGVWNCAHQATCAIGRWESASVRGSVPAALVMC
jgi:hypothetical protein